MAKTKFKIADKKEKPYIICDTNVWYQMSANKFKKPDEFNLIPTSFSLVELASSQSMAEQPKFYQNTVKVIYDNCGPIIRENPYDYILQKQFDDYKAENNDIVYKVLDGFGDLMNRDIKNDDDIDDKLKQKIIEECRNERGVTQELANLGNEELLGLRKRINTGIGQKEHLKIDASEINRKMFMSLVNQYASIKKYQVDWSKFDWSMIELFMICTELYFRKLEVTKGMKIRANDIVDWFNLLYVSPEDKYLTFDDRWRNFILNDERISRYLFV
jgi:hypothetical protein